MIKRFFTIVGWMMSLALLAGCVPGSEDEPTAVAMPTPTKHPFLNVEGTGVSDAGLTLSIEEEVEPTPDPSDATSFLIDNITVTVGDSDATLSWTTGRASVSSIEYGRTGLFELGSVGEGMTLTRHAVKLDGLEPETTYYYRISAIDTVTGEKITQDSAFDTISLAPVIDIWYGPEQKYGNIGIPKRWFNIFGNVYDRDGVASLSYSLNGGPELPLSIGPDLRRLSNVGDFNIDLARESLNPGRNEVVIIAADALGFERREIVGIMYEPDNVWPGDYEVNWSTVTDIQDVAQVVDGKWEIDDNALHIVEPGYDRLVAIGDVAWTDYEVEVPITLYEVFDDGFSVINNGPALGILVRWTGHTDFPIADWQPKVGWKPFGVLAWYWWKEPDLGFWLLEGTKDVGEEISAAAPEFGVTYMLKVQVETVSQDVGFYSLKVWPQGEPEPEEWMLEAEVEGQPNGSFLLLAHHVDVRFGNVKVSQLAPPTDNPVYPVLSGSGFISATNVITATAPITTTAPLTETVPSDTETNP